MVAVEDRVVQLEAAEQIRQLVARYAVAYDARDLQTLRALYPPQMRDAVGQSLEAELPAGRTFHLTAEPAVTFEGGDRARGTVVCRVEREDGSEWIVSGVTYSDRYVREDGAWYLAERTPQVRYSSDVLARP